MDNNIQAQGGCVGCAGGVPNYKNDIFISIVEQYLPQGLEAWREVALVYHRESMEATLCRGEDLWDNWTRKPCNRMQKPTGKPGAVSNRIFQCMEIERHIQEANRAILGVDSVESGHSRNDGSSTLLDIVAGDGFNDVRDDGDENDDEVAAVNAAHGNVVAVAMASPCPLSLPASVGGRVRAPSAISTLASWGGGDSQNK
jgi:hypothetical protein